ncbi:hypothetical protein MMC18_003385 [Xylographa bjoerkii]|nr:hypothetical protein [Xylographa bjoerkii]
MRLLATRQTFPRLFADTSVLPVGKVEVLQVTHPDDDHIGNAKDFLKTMCSSTIITGDSKYSYIDRIRGCKVVYCKIPHRKQKPNIRTRNNTNLGDKTCKIIYTAMIDAVWEKRMKIAGLIPVLTLEAYKADGSIYTDADFKFNWDTLQYKWARNSNNANELAMVYSKQAVDAMTKASVKTVVTLYYEGDRNIEAVPRENAKHLRIAEQVNVLPLGRTKLILEKDIQKEFSSDDTTEVLHSMNVLNPTSQDNHVSLWLLKTSNLNGFQRSPPKNRRTATWSPAEEALTVLLRSVPQIQDLAATIADLNTKTSVSKQLTGRVYPDLKSVVPEPHMAIGAPSDTVKMQYGFMRILGPTPGLYGKMMREILLGLYKLDSNSMATRKGETITMDGETTNRSSIVTLFERPTTDPTVGRDSSFTMLFTGDAYDKACDIRDTLVSWSQGQRLPLSPPRTIDVDVLKIPHHGSDVSQSSGFYAFVRARIYLVCGSHRDRSGNPKLSTLKAIVRGFKGKNSTPGAKPFLLFFSSTTAEKNWTSASGDTRWRSCIRAILGDPELKPGLPGSDYYYRMYRPQASPNPKNYAAFGTIVFGKTAGNELVVGFQEYDSVTKTGQWVDVSGISS